MLILKLDSKPHLLRSLETLPGDIRAAVGNHGGGHFNHSFFWPMLSKETRFRGVVAQAVNNAFGSFDNFRDKFSM